MELAISQIRSIDISSDARLLKADVHIGSEKHHIYFQSNDLPLAGNVEAFLAAALLPAMKVGGTLIVEGKASELFLKALETIMDIFCCWFPFLQRVEINDVHPVSAETSREGRVGVFFSGGVDSFYTFLKHRDEITDLIYVHGFSVPLNDRPLLKRTAETIHEIGSSFGKRVIEVETNLPSFLHKYFSSKVLGPFMFGAELAAVGHVLSPFFKRLYIAACHTYRHLHPCGSHPLLDPLWSTETLEFIHDGCEARRIDKVALLSKLDIALKTLMVCFFANSNGTYNCGICEKCLRTMINLHVAGALDRCTTFNKQLDIKRVSRIVVTDSVRAVVEDNLRALEKSEGDRRLYKALHKAFYRPQWQAQAMDWLLHRVRHFKRFTSECLRTNWD